MAVRVKICGITQREDALHAVQAGADALGFVFYQQSPRHILAPQAAAICAALPPFVTRVGLFVNAPADVVRSVLQIVPLDLLQFHGDETPAYCAQFAMPYLKAVRVQITHRWTGTVALTLSRVCTMGVTGKHKNVLYSLGYSGHGITLANLAGKVLTDIYAGDDEAWRDLPFYSQKLLYVPPERKQEYRHNDALDPLWNLLDLTPEGRGKFHPRLSYA